MGAFLEARLRIVGEADRVKRRRTHAVAECEIRDLARLPLLGSDFALGRKGKEIARRRFVNVDPRLGEEAVELRGRALVGAHEGWSAKGRARLSREDADQLNALRGEVVRDLLANGADPRKIDPDTVTRRQGVRRPTVPKPTSYC